MLLFRAQREILYFFLSPPFARHPDEGGTLYLPEGTLYLVGTLYLEGTLYLPEGPMYLEGTLYLLRRFFYYPTTTT